MNILYDGSGEHIQSPDEIFEFITIIKKKGDTILLNQLVSRKIYHYMVRNVFSAQETHTGHLL